MSSSRSEFVDLVSPLDERLSLYDPSSPPTNQPKNVAADPTKAVPQSFIDAMIVREEVYVKEQNIPLENELDEDDARSWHWVAYASIPAKASPSTSTGETAAAGEKDKPRQSSTSTKIPIGTIRLVPPPHPPHHDTIPETKEAGKDSPRSTDDNNNTHHHSPPTEPYIKLGRLAVIPEFRKAGISKLLIETALSFARSHAQDITPHLDPLQQEGQHPSQAMTHSFKGLVLVHSQTGVQKVWRRHGFEVDEGMGEWEEEGILHVGMWRRVEVKEGRRVSKAFLG